MSVYKIRYGTPEEIVPSRFAPSPACDILTEQPPAAADIQFSSSPRGVKITMPIDPKAGIYGRLWSVRRHRPLCHLLLRQGAAP